MFLISERQETYNYDGVCFPVCELQPWQHMFS